MKPFKKEEAERGMPVYKHGPPGSYTGPVHYVGVDGNGVPVVQQGNQLSVVSEQYLSIDQKRINAVVVMYRDLKTGNICADGVGDDECQAVRNCKILYVGNPNVKYLGAFPISLTEE
jgi:hypothetical protein